MAGSARRFASRRKTSCSSWRYAEVMPQPVAFSRMLMNRSSLMAPIVETAKLRSDVRFEVDLTRPPKPRQVERVIGGDNSSLRLLARIETLEDGRHTLILTPQHHIPSPLTLIPRDPIEKEMDGRVFNELSLRVTLSKDQIAVVVARSWTECKPRLYRTDGRRRR